MGSNNGLCTGMEVRMNGTVVAVKSGASRPICKAAVYNRRAARRLKKQAEEAKEQHRPDWRKLEDKERRVAERMARRFFPVDGSGLSGMPHVICCDYRYWQARRGDIDLLAPILWDGQSDVWKDGSAWRWWIDKHFSTRNEFVSKNRVRVFRV